MLSHVRRPRQPVGTPNFLSIVLEGPVIGVNRWREHFWVIYFLVAEALDGHARLLLRFFGHVSKRNSVHRKSVWRQLKRIDHCPWITASSANGDNAETECTCRSHKRRHHDSGIANRSQYPFKAALEYLHATGLPYAQASFVEVSDDRNEHRGLRDPWLATGDRGDACAAVVVADDYQRYLVAVRGCRRAARGLDNGFEDLLRDWVGLIAPATVMRLQEANGLIHQGYSFASTDF
jgi:hypothetical protein